ncbi:CBS domain-containing protein [Hydrogenophaga sp.]|uniref:CBS domain-containing protein n=1 Tax=Hydrogenophaga sp. TaxID=1904254 RepID=UPI0025BC5650|nr:CBS domain-containing protein [Hydrogenophaga sp.]
MKSVAELLSARNSPLCTVSPDASVFEALQILAKHGVGALPVVEGDKLVGVVSERDYTRKIALEGKNSREARVADIMTREVLVVKPNSRARECMALMSSKKIRHLPVVDGERLVGMLSIRDILDAIIADQQSTIEQLESYIHS